MSAIPPSGIEGKYEILEKLREGGMGAIYKVRHRLLEEIRIVKVMRPQFTQDRELKARFVREARLAIKLRHPNIAQLYDFTVDADDDTAFIVMEYIEGLNLEDMVAANGPLPTGIALEIAQQSLRAIGYLHGKGFIHRDISPDNLMLTEDAEGQLLVKLIDLGIAKGQDGAGESNLTQTGTFLGKVRYASPEQFGSEGVSSTDARSDLYSFGIVLYELLTARYPIQGRDPTSLIAGHLFRPPISFAETDPQDRVPEGVRQAVLRALAKDPGERFSSAQEFSRALAPFRAPDDIPEAEIRRILTQAPASLDFPATLPGTTQDRLDQQFGLSTTPTPSTLELARTELAPGAGPDRGEDSKIRHSVAAITLQLDRRDLLTAEAELRWAEDTFGDLTELRKLRQRLQEMRRQEAETKARALRAEIRELLATDPEQAFEKILQARSLDPASTELADLLPQVEAARERLHQEHRRAEEAATSAEIAGIEAALESGDLRRAETLLYAAEARLGGHVDLAVLHERLAEHRRRVLAEDRRAAALTSAVQQIQEHLDRSELEATGKLLDEAVVRFGVVPQLWECWERMESLRRSRAGAQAPLHEQTLQVQVPQEPAPEPTVHAQDVTDPFWEAVCRIAALVSAREHGRALKELREAAALFGEREEVQQLRKRLAAAVLREDGGEASAGR